MIIRLISPKLAHLYGPPADLPLPILTIIYLAALTPPDFEVEIIDERITEVPFEKKVDLVGITVMSGSDIHAYEIAEHYKKLGVPVVLGGFHTSLFPEEALSHADAIVMGEAEDVWEVLLSDFKKGNLKPVYKNFKGWKSDISHCKTKDDFPKELKEYIKYIEKETGVPVKIISTGADRDDTIIV